MQDSYKDYSEFIRESMRQAECEYETTFEPCEGCLSHDNRSNDCDCECNRYLPAMVFIEMQNYGKIYNEAEALCRGTLFPALDKPFYGRGGNCCERFA